jgi:hypothetical protein
MNMRREQGVKRGVRMTHKMEGTMGRRMEMDGNKMERTRNQIETQAPTALVNSSLNSHLRVRRGRFEMSTGILATLVGHRLSPYLIRPGFSVGSRHPRGFHISH